MKLMTAVVLVLICTVCHAGKATLGPLSIKVVEQGTGRALPNICLNVFLEVIEAKSRMFLVLPRIEPEIGERIGYSYSDCTNENGEISIKAQTISLESNRITSRRERFGALVALANVNPNYNSSMVRAMLPAHEVRTKSSDFFGMKSLFYVGNSEVFEVLDDRYNGGVLIVYADDSRSEESVLNADNYHVNRMTNGSQALEGEYIICLPRTAGAP